jgi:hypothetical protein
VLVAELRGEIAIGGGGMEHETVETGVVRDGVAAAEGEIAKAGSDRFIFVEGDGRHPGAKGSSRYR